MDFTVLLVCLAAVFHLTGGVRILAIFPHPGKSHSFMFQPFIRTLAERGHHITVITHFPSEDPHPRIKHISLEAPGGQLYFNSLPFDYVDKAQFSPAWMSIIGLKKMGDDACENLGHPNVQQLLRDKNRQFDLVIAEFFNTDCWASLAHVYKTPLIGIFSSVMMPWHNDRFGNPDNPSYISCHFLRHPSKMDFIQRTINTLTTFSTKIFYRLFNDWPADSVVAKHVGPNIPPVNEIVKNSSLFLINSHFSLFQPRPLVPGIIEIGGMHVGPAKGSIPAKILKFIEESPHGVVFFSLGSTVKASTMPKNKLKIFQDALSKLKQRVLWKWEEDEMIGKPANVLIEKWFPQNEILAHPKVKLFVTHGGLMGMEEAVYHGVPMVFIPLFGDQPVNSAQAEEKGVGILVDYASLSVPSLTKAMLDILENNRYSDNAKLLAKIFVDRPISIMDSAVYWIEYVIRYKGAPHLRSAAADLTWYQEYLLDVFLFISVVIFVTLYITLLLFRTFFCRTNKVQPKLKKK